MNFFKIKEYIGGNINFFQENHFFAEITGIFESKTLAIITMHLCFETTIDIYHLYAENNKMFICSKKIIALNQKYIAFP